VCATECRKAKPSLKGDGDRIAHEARAYDWATSRSLLSPGAAVMSLLDKRANMRHLPRAPANPPGLHNMRPRVENINLRGRDKQLVVRDQ
jgi:hypothetical protein